MWRWCFYLFYINSLYTCWFIYNVVYTNKSRYIQKAMVLAITMITAAIGTRVTAVRLLWYISGDEPKAAWRHLSSRHGCTSKFRWRPEGSEFRHVVLGI